MPTRTSTWHLTHTLSDGVPYPSGAVQYAFGFMYLWNWRTFDRLSHDRKTYQQVYACMRAKYGCRRQVRLAILCTYVLGQTCPCEPSTGMTSFSGINEFKKLENCNAWEWIQSIKRFLELTHHENVPPTVRDLKIKCCCSCSAVQCPGYWKTTALYRRAWPDYSIKGVSDGRGWSNIFRKFICVDLVHKTVTFCTHEEANSWYLWDKQKLYIHPIIVLATRVVGHGASEAALGVAAAATNWSAYTCQLYLKETLSITKSHIFWI